MKAGRNHLWTIIPECKYYFIIPIFTFITFKLKKYFIPWICFIIILILCFQYYNIFGLKCKRLFDPERESLFHTFQIFLNGSLIGVIYYQIEKCTHSFKFLNRFRFLLVLFTSFMYIYGLKLNSKNFHNKTSTNFFLNCQYNASLYWSIFIFLLLFINQESILSDIFNSKLLKKFGLYSFAIYLLHFESFGIVAILSKKNIIGKTSIEYITTELFGVYVFGAIFYRLIENPAMNLGNYFIKLTNL